MTPAQRGRRVAEAVLSDILPRLARWQAPVDIGGLALRVAGEIEAALAAAVGVPVQQELFARPPAGPARSKD